MWTQTKSIFPARSLHPIQTTLMILWVLTMISMPIINWTYGWDFMINMVNISVIVQVSAVIAVLWKAWGTTKTLRITALVFILGWAAEAIGSRTGYPFGSYDYTKALQPQLFHVPLLIPLAWMMMLPPAWGVGQAISRRLNPRWQLIGFVGFSALAMTAWDLFLDPQMVSWGLWEWYIPGGYFGIPWSNYLGWLFVSAIITIFIYPRQLPVAPLLLIYTITWLLQTVGLGVFWNIPGPAIVGGIIMGSLTILSWRAYFKNSL
ncbi:carotenoid biosynthesis protein [Chloroflexota bacterium]